MSHHRKFALKGSMDAKGPVHRGVKMEECMHTYTHTNTGNAHILRCVVMNHVAQTVKKTTNLI